MCCARYSHSPRAFTSFRGSPRSSFSLSSCADINRMSIPRVAPTKASAWHPHLEGTIPGGSVSLIWSRWAQTAMVMVIATPVPHRCIREKVDGGLVHERPVEHGDFPVRLPRHEQEPRAGGGAGDRELLPRTQQDQLGGPGRAQVGPEGGLTVQHPNDRVALLPHRELLRRHHLRARGDLLVGAGQV